VLVETRARAESIVVVLLLLAWEGLSAGSKTRVAHCSPRGCSGGRAPHDGGATGVAIDMADCIQNPGSSCTE
jgi:hypothetical protein